MKILLILLFPLFLQARSINFQDEYIDSQISIQRAKAFISIQKRKQDVLLELIEIKKELKKQHRQYTNKKEELNYLFEQEIESNEF